MSFNDWVSGNVAAATVATPATLHDPDPVTVANVANVAVASPTDCERFRLHWRTELERERQAFNKRRDELLSEAVIYWNGSIGDFRTVDDLRRHLTDDDLTDRELMTLPRLALYCSTVFGNG